MKDFERIIKEVTRCLSEDSHNEALIIERLNHLHSKEGDKIYQAILYVLTHLKFSEYMAKKHWNGIMAHRENMSKVFGREVGLRVALIDYFFNINRELENPIIIEIDLYEKTERLSNMDALTGLFNRRYFEHALEREFSRANRFDLDLSILILDLDNFKHYNDTYGHLAGDELLKGIAAVIMKNKRMIDVACRYGGEEFVLILPRTPKSGAMMIGERIRKRVIALKPSQNRGSFIREPVSISGGIATFPQDANSTKDLIARADEALYMAKRAGKNRISLFSLEKRRFVRVQTNNPLSYRVINPADASVHEGRVINISEGGLLFCGDREIPISSTLWIDMKLPNTRKVQSMLGIVVSSRVGDGDEFHYQVGVDFMRMERDAREAISRYIRRAIRSGTRR